MAIGSNRKGSYFMLNITWCTNKYRAPQEDLEVCSTWIGDFFHRGSDSASSEYLLFQWLTIRIWKYYTLNNFFLGALFHVSKEEQAWCWNKKHWCGPGGASCHEKAKRESCRGMVSYINQQSKNTQSRMNDSQLVASGQQNAVDRYAQRTQDEVGNVELAGGHCVYLFANRGCPLLEPMGEYAVERMSSKVFLQKWSHYVIIIRLGKVMLSPAATSLVIDIITLNEVEMNTNDTSKQHKNISPPTRPPSYGQWFMITSEWDLHTWVGIDCTFTMMSPKTNITMELTAARIFFVPRANCSNIAVRMEKVKAQTQIDAIVWLVRWEEVAASILTLIPRVLNSHNAFVNLFAKWGGSRRHMVTNKMFNRLKKKKKTGQDEAIATPTFLLVLHTALLWRWFDSRVWWRQRMQAL